MLTDKSATSGNRSQENFGPRPPNLQSGIQNTECLMTLSDNIGIFIKRCNTVGLLDYTGTHSTAPRDMLP